MFRYVVINKADKKVIGVNQGNEIPKENNQVTFLEITWDNTINMSNFDYIFKNGDLMQMEKSE